MANNSVTWIRFAEYTIQHKVYQYSKTTFTKRYNTYFIYKGRLADTWKRKKNTNRSPLLFLSKRTTGKQQHELKLDV